MLKLLPFSSASATWRTPADPAVTISGTGADPIRTALAYYLGMSLGLIFRLEIRPGSLSELELNGDGAKC